MEKLKLQTHNIVDENIKKIAELFPNCLTERLVRAENSELRTEMAIDFDMLRQELSKDIVEGPEERYQFTWPDKRNAIRLANAPTTDTLRPCREESVNFDNTQNLYIEGDNLEVLKLLRENYLGKVKMIYIDPPYNTGNDFVYNDDFAQTAGDYVHNSGQEDEEGNRLVANTESNGRFHTDWLNMIYPRLKVAKDLLSEDGVIFISIDDNEVANLKKVCDEILGEKNFVAKFDWRKKTGANDAKDIAVVTESILLYSKCRLDTLNNKIWRRDEESIDQERYKYQDEFVEERGKFYYDTLDRGGLQYSDSMNFGIEAPDGGIIYPNGRSTFINDGWIWKWSKEKVEWGIKHKFLEFVKSNKSQGSLYTIKYKVYQNVDNEGNIREYAGRAYMNLITEPINQIGNSEMKAMFENRIPFSNPKPVGLINYLFKTIKNSNALVLDFFSGSATTAHAVMQLNAEDGGKRKFIMVQLPEATWELDKDGNKIPKKEAAAKAAFEAGYMNICEIGKERIRRAGVQILELSIKNLEKEKVIEKYARELSEIRSLEEVYGLGGNGLSVNQKTAEGGDIRTGRPDAESSSLNTIEHSGGAIQGSERVCPVFESGKGITCGTGDTIVDLRTLEVLNKFGYRIRLDAIGGNQQNDLFFDYTSHLQNLSSKLSALSSDFGFRVLKLDSSNMQDVYYSPEQFNENLLFEDNIKPDRTEEDLLFQAMIELGIELSAKIEQREIAGKTVWSVADNYLMACFDKDVNETTITEIARQHPYYFVLRDSSLATDNVADNFEQIWEEYSKDTIRKII